MTAQKCVVEGCNLEYDVICSFSFYNFNTTSDNDNKRQEWIDGAMQESSEYLWRHVSLQLCGYHFELDAQGLWIDSPMLPDLLTAHDKPAVRELTEHEKKAAELIAVEHNYCAETKTTPAPPVSRLNVRPLVDTLGYLSLKNLQRKQLWVVRVETESAEATITQAEQVITKMQPSTPKQVLEIIPQTSTAADTTTQSEGNESGQSEVLQMMDESIPENFIYEIAEEQEISMDEVKEISPGGTKEWSVNIVQEPKQKYAYIKHCATGKKKRHFTADMNEITLQGDFENYYILPDADPSVGVEITTSYEPENYIVEEYQHLVLDERPKKKSRASDPSKRKKKMKITPMREVKAVEIKSEIGDDWAIQNDVYEQEGAAVLGDKIDELPKPADKPNKRHHFRRLYTISQTCDESAN